MLPALAGEHYFANRPKGISLQKLLFGTCPTLLATTKSLLKALKNSGKTLSFFNIFTFRPLLVRICIKIAYLSKCTPRSSRKHILVNRCTILFNKNQFFRGLDVPPHAFLPLLGCKADKQNT